MVAKAGELTAAGRVRVIADLPFTDDFAGWKVGAPPPYLTNSATKFVVEQHDGEAVLAKNPSAQQLNSHITFLGRSDWSGYTIQADLMSAASDQYPPDVGVIDSGYTLMMMGAGQKLQLESWPAARRMEREVEFPWQPGVWYTMKLRVDPRGDTALIRGKVWRRGEAEPAAWTVEVEDKAPILQGSPGLAGYSPVPVYFDNVVVKGNQ